MSKLKIIRSFEPQKGNESRLNEFVYPNQVREFVAYEIDDAVFKEVGASRKGLFLNGFCRNYLGLGGIAWIVGDAPKGTDYHTPDKFYPAPSELNEFND